VSFLPRAVTLYGLNVSVAKSNFSNNTIKVVYPMNGMQMSHCQTTSTQKLFCLLVCWLIILKLLKNKRKEVHIARVLFSSRMTEWRVRLDANG